MFKVRSLREIPQSPADVGCLIFLLSFVPASFIFELCIVMPAFHKPGSIMFILTWLGGVYVIYNIMGNYIACILEDPSIRGKIFFIIKNYFDDEFYSLFRFNVKTTFGTSTAQTLAFVFSLWAASSSSLLALWNMQNLCFKTWSSLHFHRKLRWPSKSTLFFVISILFSYWLCILICLQQSLHLVAT